MNYLPKAFNEIFNKKMSIKKIYYKWETGQKTHPYNLQLKKAPQSQGDLDDKFFHIIFNSKDFEVVYSILFYHFNLFSKDVDFAINIKNQSILRKQNVYYYSRYVPKVLHKDLFKLIPYFDSCIEWSESILNKISEHQIENDSQSNTFVPVSFFANTTTTHTGNESHHFSKLNPESSQNEIIELGSMMREVLESNRSLLVKIQDALELRSDNQDFKISKPLKSENKLSEKLLLTKEILDFPNGVPYNTIKILRKDIDPALFVLLFKVLFNLKDSRGNKFFHIPDQVLGKLSLLFEGFDISPYTVNTNIIGAFNSGTNNGKKYKIKLAIPIDKLTLAFQPFVDLLENKDLILKTARPYKKRNKN